MKAMKGTKAMKAMKGIKNVVHPPAEARKIPNLFLSSNQFFNEVAFKALLKDYWTKTARPGTTIYLMGLFDKGCVPQTGGTNGLMNKHGMYKIVRTVAKELREQFRLKILSVGYKFVTKFKPHELTRFRKRFATPGSILVVVGERTPHLADAVHRSGLAKAIRDNVLAGTTLYASYGAGTVLASRTTEIHADRPPPLGLQGQIPNPPVDHPTMRGLHLLNAAMGPYCRGAKHPRGAIIESKIANRELKDTQGKIIGPPCKVICLRDNPKDCAQDCYCVLQGKVHSSTTILGPVPAPQPF